MNTDTGIQSGRNGYVFSMKPRWNTSDHTDRTENVWGVFWCLLSSYLSCPDIEKTKMKPKCWLAEWTVEMGGHKKPGVICVISISKQILTEAELNFYYLPSQKHHTTVMARGIPANTGLWHSEPGTGDSLRN